MATAATAAKGITSPSPFATLLRRSKFASYDPKIGQVYTTFGGDSHRGNYGLKRPLAFRTREPFITVASVDSLQQQTEWSHAEKEARWMRKVAEVSRTPKDIHGGDLWKKSGPDGRFQWKVDSDFALGTTDADTALEIKKVSQGRGQGSTLNIDAMTPKQFQRYLGKLRALRPAFREFLEAEQTKAVEKNRLTGHAPWKSKVRSSNLLEQSCYETDLHKTFLSKHMAQAINDPESHILEQDVHPNGALAYTHLTDLEHYFWRKPLPGRAVGKIGNIVVSFAGVNARLPHSKSEGIQPIDWKSLVERGADTGRGISKFRVSQMEVFKPPQVVGHKPEGMADMDVRMWLSSHSRLDIVRANPNLPWTREYVSQVSDAPITGTRPGMTNPPPVKRKSAYELAGLSESQEAESQKLLESLYVMLEKQQQQGPPKSGDGYA
ncbi:hypothetical protein BDM02DRAFT_3123488 [Thelephora ganbajun]|uniref:Uncharacterized protein n=1 Tax=Thelephora ganbajun TaxID=370292 RepID=A0ACB6Z143_THEGA|nr:hypothetical protein BDM02DRAFT_3123488 [Thelephora ganbajun]